MATANMMDRAPDTACNPSAFGSIEDAARQIDDATSRVRHFVERLCGVEPEKAEATGGPRAVPSGLLSAADMHAESIRENAGRIFAAMERLEKRLP